jgi:hypothetical protein
MSCFLYLDRYPLTILAPAQRNLLEKANDDQREKHQCQTQQEGIVDALGQADLDRVHQCSEGRALRVSSSFISNGGKQSATGERLLRLDM